MTARIQHIEIDLSDIASPEELHTRLMQRLGFPYSYGRNWDAFWDVVTEQDRLPQTLTLRGWASFQKRLPEAARQFRESLQDAGRQYSHVDYRIEYAS